MTYIVLVEEHCLETYRIFELHTNEQWKQFEAKIEEVYVALTQPFSTEKSKSLFNDLHQDFSGFIATVDTLRKTFSSDMKNSKVSLY